jgi:hypothetical protein
LKYRQLYGDGIIISIIIIIIVAVLISFYAPRMTKTLELSKPWNYQNLGIIILPTLLLRSVIARSRTHFVLLFVFRDGQTNPRITRGLAVFIVDITGARRE